MIYTTENELKADLKKQLWRTTTMTEAEIEIEISIKVKKWIEEKCTHFELMEDEVFPFQKYRLEHEDDYHDETEIPDWTKDRYDEDGYCCRTKDNCYYRPNSIINNLISDFRDQYL